MYVSGKCSHKVFFWKSSSEKVFQLNRDIFSKCLSNALVLQHYFQIAVLPLAGKLKGDAL